MNVSADLPRGADDANVRWTIAEFRAAGADPGLLGLERASQWYTAQDLARLGVPGVGQDLRHIRKKATAERWRLARDTEGRALARMRQDGAWEYDTLVLPLASQAHIAALELGGTFNAVLARERPEGGGTEFHWSLLPALAAKELVVRHARSTQGGGA